MLEIVRKLKMSVEEEGVEARNGPWRQGKSIKYIQWVAVKILIKRSLQKGERGIRKKFARFSPV